MNADDTLFAAGDLRGRPLALTPEREVVLWDRISKFPILFASDKETNFAEWGNILKDTHTILVGFHSGAAASEPMGLGMVYDIVPGVEAKVQVSFFDSKLKEREPLVRAFVGWVFDVLLVRRVGAHIRADARSMRSFLERVGLVFEGIDKNYIQRGNRLIDVYRMAVCAHEADVHFREGRPWAKPRVRLLETYETR